MEPKDLAKLWSDPDNTRLTPRQFSIRLPLHVSAKLSALCEMFPQRSRTQIIGDLLASALEKVPQGLSDKPYVDEEEECEARGINPTETILGERGRYYNLAEKYEKELEKEMGETGNQPPLSPETPTPAKESGRTKRAPRGEGASAQATTKARPAAAPRGDQRSRKRGTAGGRRSG